MTTINQYLTAFCFFLLTCTTFADQHIILVKLFGSASQLCGDFIWDDSKSNKVNWENIIREIYNNNPQVDIVTGRINSLPLIFTFYSSDPNYDEGSGLFGINLEGEGENSFFPPTPNTAMISIQAYQKSARLHTHQTPLNSFENPMQGIEVNEGYVIYVTIERSENPSCTLL